jgi:purine-nucleoside phosphorylase
MHMSVTAVVLGSGWPLPADFTVTRTYPLSAVYPPSATMAIPPQEVSGHAGHVLYGHIQQQPVWVVAGRRHIYQGYSAHYVTHPIRWLSQQGVTRLVLTNAAGGINPHFQPGDVMLITDQLNLTGHNPLTAEQPGQPVTFMDTSSLYTPAWVSHVKQQPAMFPLHTGVYAGLLGPSYETPAEVRMLATLGADAVGMSTVLETLQAAYLQLPVLGVSLIANAAAGLSTAPLSHHDVLTQVQAKQAELSQWLNMVISQTEY